MKLAVLAAASPIIAFAVYAAQAQADIGTQEDSPAWSCVDDGNHVCGPNNPEHKPAACYDDGGVIVAMWPCWVEIDPQTGDSDVYTPDDRPGHPTSVY